MLKRSIRLVAYGKKCARACVEDGVWSCLEKGSKALRRWSMEENNLKGHGRMRWRKKA